MTETVPVRLHIKPPHHTAANSWDVNCFYVRVVKREDQRTTVKAAEIKSQHELSLVIDVEPGVEYVARVVSRYTEEDHIRDSVPFSICFTHERVIGTTIGDVKPIVLPHISTLLLETDIAFDEDHEQIEAEAMGGE